MSSSTQPSRSVYDISSSSDGAETPVRFKVRMFHDYKRTAWLPSSANIAQSNRWIVITTQHGRMYQVEMVQEGDFFLLQRGWSLLAATEALQEGDKLIFEFQMDNKFTIWLHKPIDHPPSIGFSTGRVPRVLRIDQINQPIICQGVEITNPVSKAIRKVWNASAADGPVYVCRLLISPAEGDFLIFNKAYTTLIPKEKANVAMRFIGSKITIPGAIKTYRDGTARMVKEWPLYAASHHLSFGETFICKIHRGPTVWEFIGHCVGRP